MSQPLEFEVVAVTRDLMDRSKITAALPEAVVVPKLDAVRALAARPALVLVDLRLVDSPEHLAGLAERVVAFGSHVDEAVLSAAAEAGAEALPRSLFFRRLADGRIGEVPDDR